jgi:hypothetical protein
MYENLYLNNLSSFSENQYLSSSEYSAGDVWVQGFYGGVQGYFNRRYIGWVRHCAGFLMSLSTICHLAIKGGAGGKYPLMNQDGIVLRPSCISGYLQDSFAAEYSLKDLMP